MHAIHHTEGFILKSIPVGEANRRIWLFTRDFGLVVAQVQGVRKSGAKLQSQLPEYSLIAGDLVRGREVWRLVGATLLDAPIAGRLRDPLSRAYARTLSALERFLIGEDQNELLFTHVAECAACLHEGVSDHRYFDTLSLWKMLALLGYIAPTEAQEQLLVLPFSQALSQMNDTLHKTLIAEAKRAIIESHL